MSLAIAPHPLAPLFQNPEEAPKILQQAIDEVEGSDYSTTEVVRQLLRQAGFVNFWFCLRFIAGFNGPFELLNDTFNQDMCNFGHVMLAEGSRNAIAMPRKHRKDLACDTPILTANRGWTTHRDLVVGDYVFSPQGAPIPVLAITPTFQDQPVLKITFTDGHSITCGEHHQWVISEKLTEAKDLKPFDDVGTLRKELVFEATPLPIHPYLLGAWLGDGHSTSPRITCAYKDNFIIEKIISLGYRIVENKSSNENTGFYAFGGAGRGQRGKGIYPIFRKLGLHQNKHIPRIYLKASAAQRWELLRGLMDTDGWTNGRGTASIGVIKEALARGIYELAAGLALKPRFRTEIKALHGAPYPVYCVSFQHHHDRNPFSLPRKAELSIRPGSRRDRRRVRSIEQVTTVPTNCIQVGGDGTYLAGEGLIPTHNSTIFTVGHCIWKLLRDPNRAICIFSGVYERSEDFLHTVQQFYSMNPLATWLYPEWMGGEINAKHLILPNRTRYQTEPSIRCGTAGGSSEGQHFTDIKLDDIVGLEQLDSMKRSNAEMLKRRDWMLSSQRTLLRDWHTGIVDVCFTRYAVDDAYEPIMQNMKKKFGFWEGIDYEEKPDGEWKIYYRLVREKGKIVFPEAITEEGLAKLAEEDPWTLITQYENNPQATGLAELNEYNTKECRMAFDDDQGWLLLFGPADIVPLADCDLVLAGDPAGTEKYVNARTSRSAAVALARDPKDRKIIIEVRADYVPPETFFDWLFLIAKKFTNYFRKTLFEAQGPFRALYNVLLNEQNKRGEYLHLDKVTAISDKDARIRNILQPELSRGLLWVVSEFKKTFDSEMKVFPQSQRKDILDATAIAIAGSTRPYDREETATLHEREDAWKTRLVGAAGY